MSGVLPYVPLTRSERGAAIWREIKAFFGISDSFPHAQLLAHSERMKTVTFVTAPARLALDAAGGQAHTPLTVVTAGTRMFEENHCPYAACSYRCLFAPGVVLFRFVLLCQGGWRGREVCRGMLSTVLVAFFLSFSLFRSRSAAVHARLDSCRS